MPLPEGNDFPRGFVNRLSALIPPPHKPDQFAGSTLNPALGPPIALPADYLEFMRTYGPGWFTEDGHPTIQILDLAGETDMLRVRQSLDMAHQNHLVAPSDCPSAYPNIPGILPWGAWDQGFTLCWWVINCSADWRVVAVAPRDQDEWYPCSFADYVLGNLGREPGIAFRTYLLPDDAEIRYCPSSHYR